MCVCVCVCVRVCDAIVVNLVCLVSERSFESGSSESYFVSGMGNGCLVRHFNQVSGSKRKRKQATK